MRRLLLVILVVAAGMVQAQQFRASLLAGMNLGQVDGDEVYGFNNPGINLGVQASAPLGNNLFLTLETNYNQKGAYQGPQSNDETYTAEYDLNLNYVEVPVILHYNDKDILTAGLGIAYARLLDEFEEENSGNTEPYIETKGFNKSDWLALFDLQFRLYKSFYANFRYSYSMFPIRSRRFTAVAVPDNSWVRQQYNNTLMFRIAYRINEKPTTESESRRR